MANKMHLINCTICLDSSNDPGLLRKLDNVDERGIQWSWKLKYIAPEVEWANENSICEACIENLEISCNFKKQCLNWSNNFKSGKNEGGRGNNSNSSESEGIDENIEDNYNNAYSLAKEEYDEETVFICYHCKDSFNSKNTLKEHIVTVHISVEKSYKSARISSKPAYGEFRCEHCRLCYRTEKIFNIHTKKCMRSIKSAPHICIKCDEPFKCLSALQNHEQLGCELNINKVLFCNVCDQLFNLPQELRKHVEQEHRTEACVNEAKIIRQKKMFHCDICGDQFKVLREVMGHYAQAHSLDKEFVKPYSCEACGKRFKSSTNLMTHKLYHERSRTHTCSICGKSFITKNDLLGHETIHRADRKFKCDRCEKSFKTNTNLRTHRLIVHTDPQLWKFSCGVCSKRFPMKSTHDQHYRRHTGEKNFLCALCEKAFTSKSELQEHMRYHSDVRRFKCDRCPKEYRKKISLLVHLTGSHGIGDAKAPVKAKKHACHLCPGRFPDRAKLARHLCTHSGRKPFACSACDKKFTDKSYLKMHLKNAHDIVGKLAH